MISRNRLIFRDDRSCAGRVAGMRALGPVVPWGYAVVGEEGFAPSAPVTRLLPDGSGHLCYQGLRRLGQRAASCLSQPINVEYGAHMVSYPGSIQRSAY